MAVLEKQAMGVGGVWFQKHTPQDLASCAKGSDVSPQLLVQCHDACLPATILPTM